MTKRVLVIEDEENIRHMTRLTLEAAGYEVGEAANGMQGLETYGHGSDWDVVLLDQRMPGMDGLETLQKIKDRNPAARVIMVTAYASIELAVDAMKLGATDFVRKPLTPEILRGAVQAALEKGEGKAAAALQDDSTISLSTKPGVIPTITMNGFEILRSAEEPEVANEHRFVVRNPSGERHEVIVEIAQEVVGYVERMTRRQLPAHNSFWVTRAERFLGNYLWTEGKIPPDGRLTLNEIDQADLPVAASWSER
jgi:DNA-binding response OmpR family regulator